MKNTFPDWSALMELWLQTHHKGQPAVIFSSPLAVGDAELDQRIALLESRFPDEEMWVHAEFAVLVCPSLEAATKIMDETPEEKPFTLTWDGERIVSHHS